MSISQSKFQTLHQIEALLIYEFKLALDLDLSLVLGRSPLVQKLRKEYSPW